MIMKKIKPVLLICIILVFHAHLLVGQNRSLGRKTLNERNNEGFVGNSQSNIASEKPNQRQRRDTGFINNEKRMLQFDYDQNSDNGSSAEITVALNQSFTVCFAFMIDTLDADLSEEKVFQWESEDDGYELWFQVDVFSGNITIKDSNFTDLDTEPYALSTWKRMCYSSDGILVVEGRKEKNLNHTKSELEGNTTLRFGLIAEVIDPPLKQMKMTQVNLFSPALSVERMQNITDWEVNRVCEEHGNILDWSSNLYRQDPSSGLEKVEWIWHGKARSTVMNVDEHICWSSARNFDYFFKNTNANAEDLQPPTLNDAWSFLDCMAHCKKLGTRYPPLSSYDDVVNLAIDLSDDVSYVWLPVTDGVKSKGLKRPDHWAESILAKPGVWRDFYTGEQINTTDLELGEEQCFDTYPDSHCIQTDSYTTFSSDCSVEPIMKCPFCMCENNKQNPKHSLLLRGLCPSSFLRTGNFKRGLFYALHSTQLEENHMTTPNAKQFFYVGGMSSRIDFDETSSQWILTETQTNTSAVSLARVETFAVGKYNWTISDDHNRCQDENGAENGKYRTELKLTGCKPGFVIESNSFLSPRDISQLEDGEFTCDDGQCVSMKKRCNKLHDCKDRSDEKGCKLLTLSDGYDKNVPPFTLESFVDYTINPVNVNVTIRLLKMMGIDEDENSIDLQFEIMLEWLDYRLSFNNLKEQTYLNALTEEDKRSIWLPIVVFDNTDQKETTRLGAEWEWSTSVIVTREGNFTR